MPRWCLFIVSIISFAFLALDGCKPPGPDLVVQGISGPSSIKGGSSASYSVSATGDTGLAYAWAVDPSSSGSILYADTAAIVLQTSQVENDLSAKLQVTVVGDHDGPLVNSTNLIIMKNTPGSDGWARSWGSHYATGWDGGNDLAVDTSGEAFVAGAVSWEADFDPGDGVDQYTGIGWEEAFVSKFDPIGNWLWSRAGDRGVTMAASGVATDTTGTRMSRDISARITPISIRARADIVKCAGYEDASLTKFDTNGNFLWALNWGGIGNDFAADVALTNRTAFMWSEDSGR